MITVCAPPRTSADSPDSVWKIRQSKTPDTVWGFASTASRKPNWNAWSNLGILSLAVVALCQTPLGAGRQSWPHEDENPPVGLILCAEKNEAVAHYSLEGLPNKVMATEYLMALPDEKLLTAELEKTHRAMELKAITSDSLPRKSTKGRNKKKTSN